MEEALTENCDDAFRHGIVEESSFGGSGEGRRATASFAAAAIGGGVEKEESFKGERRLSTPRLEAAMDRSGFGLAPREWSVGALDPGRDMRGGVGERDRMPGVTPLGGVRKRTTKFLRT